MILNDKKLIRLLQLAHAAERAAAFAYQGHAASVKYVDEKKAINQIEEDEWIHRQEVRKIMDKYEIEPATYFEIKLIFIGKFIGFACHFIGRFMPNYFAGRLESGNVNEYIIMRDKFNALGIYKHDEILTEMASKEKEHEDYFLEMVEEHPCLDFFEAIFKWGKKTSFNELAMNKQD